MVNCTNCGSVVEELRVELLASTICSKCAKAGVNQPEDIRGFMVYDHKTSPDMCIMSSDQYDYASTMSVREGQTSILTKIKEE